MYGPQSLSVPVGLFIHLMVYIVFTTVVTVVRFFIHWRVSYVFALILIIYLAHDIASGNIVFSISFFVYLYFCIHLYIFHLGLRIFYLLVNLSAHLYKMCPHTCCINYRHTYLQNLGIFTCISISIRICKTWFNLHTIGITTCTINICKVTCLQNYQHYYLHKYLYKYLQNYLPNYLHDLIISLFAR